MKDEEDDPYMQDRFGGASLCAILQAPRQHCEMEIVEDLAFAVEELESNERKRKTATSTHFFAGIFVGILLASLFFLAYRG